MTESLPGYSKNSGIALAKMESVADILERQLDDVIHEWLALVEEQEDLMSIPLSFEERSGHLPALLHEVIARLRLDTGAKAPISIAASHHGDVRCTQGYSAAMVVEESRLLAVCLFTILHNNTNRLEYSKLLPDVITIADEVDKQLKQQILRFSKANAIATKAMNYFYLG